MARNWDLAQPKHNPEEDAVMQAVMDYVGQSLREDIPEYFAREAERFHALPLWRQWLEVFQARCDRWRRLLVFRYRDGAWCGSRERYWPRRGWR